MPDVRLAFRALRANIANLLLARTAARRHELNVRLALGVFAGWLPARRAARIDPARVLTNE